MERRIRSKFNTQIYEEACDWFVECRAGDLDGAARAELERWLRKSPEHQSAYLEITAIWNEGPTLDPANQWDIDTLILQATEQPANIIALGRGQGPLGHFPQPLPANTATRSLPSTQSEGGRNEGRRHRLFAIAASILLVAAVFVTYIVTTSGVYATDLGEQRSLVLSDGSTVQLDSLSKIRLRYTGRERTIELLQGQAFFHVAKDAERPFIVHSGQTRVRAVGTQFDVYRRTDGTVVTVLEGRITILGVPREERVRLTAGDGEGNDSQLKDADYDLRIGKVGGGLARPANEVHSSMLKHAGGQSLATGTEAVPPDSRDAILLAAGEQIMVTPKAALRTPHPDLIGATAWTRRQLVFDTASLTEVAEEFNRYNERQLVIDPSALGTLHVSGVFSSADPASLINFLLQLPGLRVTETRKEILVEKAP